jgi:hypothetical protein
MILGIFHLLGAASRRVAVDVGVPRIVQVHLATPEKIQTLQRKLYLKAKREPSFRFYALYDKVYRTDILAHAYATSKANGGAPGVEGTRFEDIEAYGRERFLAELRQELRAKRYRPEAVLRVMIPKPNGGERPLGIPTVKDRVVQAAVKLVLEPIFEADFTDNAYGYRPGRSAKDAVREVHKTLKAGYVHVVDADLSKYFDTIPHTELMHCVSRRVSDGAILHLVKMWLKTPIEEEGDNGKPTRRCTGNRGTPQGGVITPPTILQTCPASGALDKRDRAYLVYHPDVFLANLYSFDQSTDDLSPRRPFGILKTFSDLFGKILESSNEQFQLGLLDPAICFGFCLSFQLV